MIPPTSIDGTDITGATIDGTDVQEITVDGDVVFGAETPAGKYLLASSRTSGEVFMYEMSTPFDISTAGSAQSQFTPGGDYRGHGMSLEGDLIHLKDGGTDIEQFSLTTPFDLTTTTSDHTISGTDFGGIAFNDDGSVFYDAERNAGIINQFNLSTNYDISTRGSQTSESFPHDVRGISVVDSGTKLFINGGSGNLNKYDLTTPYDVTTRTNRTTGSFTSDDSREIVLKEDGTVFFTDNRSDDTIDQYDMTTAYDLNSITFVDSISAPATDSISLALNGV